MNYTEHERLEAAQWFLDIHDVEEPSAEMLQEWGRWMETSESHRVAFAAVESAWHEATSTVLRRASPAAKASDDYDGSVSIHEWRMGRARGNPITRNIDPAGRVSRWRPRWARLAVAAAIGGTAFVLLLPAISRLSRTVPPTEFVTQTGEQTLVRLADGSQLNLGGRSALSVRYSRTGRDVRLKAGEAFFTVQKDASRPFRVHVLNSVVTATGTSFDVRTANDRVVVAVAEGSVQVGGADSLPNSAPMSPSALRPHPSAFPSARVARGESLAFVSHPDARAIEPATITRVDPTQPARWREGWLVYRDEPLRDVLADIGRYTDRQIVIDTAVPVDSHFTGAVFKDSVVEWLNSLPNAFPVTVRAEGDRILITPSP